jgi:Ca-activated chloride channel family protein
MSRWHRAVPFVLPLLVAAVALPLHAADEVNVSIIDPGPFDPVSGSVQVRIGVVAPEPVTRVDLYVDGTLRVQLTEEPWDAVVDVGQDNEEHIFRAVAHTASGATGEMVSQTPAIQVNDTLDLPLQQLFVTVTRAGDRVGKLGRDDFQVVDNDTRQKLVTFEGGDAPLTAVLLVDSSQSMRGSRLASAVRGVRSFTAGMRDLDEVMGILFSDRMLAATPFTDEPQQIDTSLGEVEAAGGTALTDFLYSSLKILDGRQGRRVVVVLSDGYDVYSALAMRDVLWKIRRSQAMVYWLALRDRSQNDTGLYTSAWRNADANKQELDTLRDIVRESGGRVLEIDDASQIPQAFGSILTELRGQYVLGYYPTDLRRDGSWRQVHVEVKGFGTKVRCREGYVDY